MKKIFPSHFVNSKLFAAYF